MNRRKQILTLKPQKKQKQKNKEKIAKLKRVNLWQLTVKITVKLANRFLRIIPAFRSQTVSSLGHCFWAITLWMIVGAIGRGIRRFCWQTECGLQCCSNRSAWVGRSVQPTLSSKYTFLSAKTIDRVLNFDDVELFINRKIIWMDKKHFPFVCSMKGPLESAVYAEIWSFDKGRRRVLSLRV